MSAVDVKHLFYDKLGNRLVRELLDIVSTSHEPRGSLKGVDPIL